MVRSTSFGDSHNMTIKEIIQGWLIDEDKRNYVQLVDSSDVDYIEDVTLDGSFNMQRLSDMVQESVKGSLKEILQNGHGGGNWRRLITNLLESL